MTEFMMSNADVFRAIATEALTKSLALLDAGRQPIEGQPGRYALQFDPDQRSFKESLIAIVFAGVYFEALVYVELRRRFTKEDADKIDRRPYGERLVALGIDDEATLSQCDRLRVSRNELVHEKAFISGSVETVTWRTAQTEATHALSFVNAIAARLTTR